MDFIEPYERRCFRTGVWCFLWSMAAVVFLALAIVAYEEGWMVRSENMRAYGMFGVAGLASFLFALLSLSFWRESRKRIDRYLENTYL